MPYIITQVRKSRRRYDIQVAEPGLKMNGSSSVLTWVYRANLTSSQADAVFAELRKDYPESRFVKVDETTHTVEEIS